MSLDWDIIFKLFMLVFGVLMSITGFLSARTLNKVDANQVELFNRLHTLERDFYELRGEHKATDHVRQHEAQLYQKSGVLYGQVSDISTRISDSANVTKTS